MLKHQATTREACKLLFDGILALGRAERQGMRIDVDYCEKKKQHLSRKISRAEALFKETNFYKHWAHTRGGSVNLSSNAQLSHFLYKTKKLDPPKTTTTGQGSTDEEALKLLGIPEIDSLLEIRKWRKIRDTYLDAFVREAVDGYVHPFFNLNTVRTFRSSSDRPNFQNIPKRDEEAMALCRKAIYPRPGHLLLEADYSGLEVRISQCYHKDPNMKKYIQDPTTDMHGDMASQIFRIDTFDRHVPEYKVLRNASKNGFVFPQFYGDYYVNCAENMACRWGGLPKGKWKSGQGLPLPGGIRLSDHLISQGLRSYSAFEDHVKAVEKDFWGRRFVVYQDWKDRWWKEYQKRGYIDMFTGFRCGGVMRRNEVINTPIQGSAFHCLLWSFIQLDRIMVEEGWDSRLIGQIHDAIVMDVNPAELDHVVETIRRVTCKDLPEAWPWIIVPLEIEIETCPVDGSWNDKHDFSG